MTPQRRMGPGQRHVQGRCGLCVSGSGTRLQQQVAYKKLSTNQSTTLQPIAHAIYEQAVVANRRRQRIQIKVVYNLVLDARGIRSGQASMKLRSNPGGSGGSPRVRSTAPGSCQDRHTTTNSSSLWKLLQRPTARPAPEHNLSQGTSWRAPREPALVKAFCPGCPISSASGDISRAREGEI
jgi:hypothetical protein